ncbi:hypothetical protein N5T66_07735 [Aliarcobacter cryaerophilus]|uniref:hypothetical protein n=1 Tax=Aliarcobacter cryaerophilus TaxID=28198 RepID=UPI0021B37B72|nr:hypothetical protein [Aliarcobacter cryaerophilus]MCT7433175.1 hypothetical protein [Aliarcobacter cryaerophilus]
MTNIKENKIYITMLFFIAMLLYCWTIFEPFAGDALLHLMDDTQIYSLSDMLKVFFTSHNDLFQENYRLTFFHRPVFNELYINLLKFLFSENLFLYRLTNIVLLALSSIFVYKILYNITQSNFSSFLGGVFLVCNPSLFYGIYEFGLSFSELLVFLSVTSIYFLQKYTLTGKKLYLLLTLLFTFSTVFTKESAMFFPFSIILFYIYFINYKNNFTFKNNISKTINIFKKKYKFFIILIFISILYLYTRYLKLGSIFAIVAVGQEATLFDSFSKLFAYLLHILYVPTKILPNYMILSLSDLPIIQIILKITIFIFFIYFIYRFIKEKYFDFLLLFSISLMLFIPIVKASRNAPYYSDLMVVPFSIIIGMGFFYFTKNLNNIYIKILISLITILLLLNSIFFQKDYISKPFLWLTNAQGVGRAILSDFSYIQTENFTYVGTSGVRQNEGIFWVMNQHSGDNYFGSIFAKNFNLPIDKFLRSSEQITKNTNIAFIDFIDSNLPRKLSSSPLPGFGRLLFTKFDNGFVKVKIENIYSSYNINNSKVVRIECKNKVLDKTTIDFINNNDVLTREINSFNNLSKEKTNSFFEFVTNNEYKILEFNENFDEICKEKVVYIYKDIDMNKEQFDTIINKSPEFQDKTAWIGNINYDINDNSVIVGPGVDNKNVLIQDINVDELTAYKITAEIASLSEKSQARLQINWHDKDSKFINASIKVITPEMDYKKFSKIFISPQNAKIGILYITPHNEKDIVKYKSIKVEK